MANRRQSKKPLANIRSVDFHGLTAAEAQHALVVNIDRCILDGIEQLRIIHGIGTGRVKSAVLAVLARMKQVSHYSAEPGNPGVTIAYL